MWLHKSYTVIVCVHLWAAGVTAVEEMKFCTAADKLCCMHHMLKEKVVSVACLITDSILLWYRDILLIMKHGSAVTSNSFDMFPCLLVQQYTTFKWKHTISGVHVSPGSTETLVRGGGKINNTGCCLSYTSVKQQQQQQLLSKIIKIGWWMIEL